jgi:formate dehydrogenase maturation protein FdhE
VSSVNPDLLAALATASFAAAAMIWLGLQKKLLQERRRRTVCPACGSPLGLRRRCRCYRP